MSDDGMKRDWVKLALGFDVPSDGSAGEWRPAEKLMPIFRDAKEAVDADIEKLQRVLSDMEDEDLEQIVEFGLFGVTEGQTVKLMAALMGADQGGEDARRRVVAAVREYEDFLAGAPIIDLLESNPFGVSVPMRKTLGGALSHIGQLAGA